MNETVPIKSILFEPANIYIHTVEPPNIYIQWNLGNLDLKLAICIPEFYDIL
jgi:hypothetical protein